MSDDAMRLERRVLEVKRRLRILDDSLESVPHWLPAAELGAMVSEVRRRVEDLADERERKMAVVIVGPTGAGKSTLLNALAGQDGLSRTGPQRPTTRALTVFCADPGDGRYFSEKVGAHNVNVVSSREANNLRNLVIVDTPDTNSVAADEHEPIVAAAIRAADVLICAFPAENAVRRDQIEYLGRWVDQFNQSALYAVVTMSERYPAAEMDGQVVKPLLDVLESVWKRAPAKTFAVSARSHLRNPEWGPTERRDPACRDDFLLLKEELAVNFNRQEAVADMRGARMEQWATEAERLVGWQAAESAPHAGAATAGIERLAGELWSGAAKHTDTGVSLAGLEFSIARRLWGPVSWCFMAWTLVVQLMEILMALAGALQRVTGGFWRPLAPDASADCPSPGDLGTTLSATAAVLWPDIRTSLRQAGFDRAFQENPLSPPNDAAVCASLQAGMRTRRDEMVRQMAGGTFHGLGTSLFLNLLFLAPVLYILLSAVRIYWGSGTFHIGLGGDGMWFLALWWLVVLSFMHGWIYWKEKRLGGKARREFLLNSGNPASLSQNVIDELARVSELAREYAPPA